MTRADARKAILQTWIAAWHTKVGGSQSAPTVPYAIDNRRMTQTSGPFAVVEITGLPSDQVTMGAVGLRRFERPGFIEVRLYGPRDQGTAALDTLAEHVKDIFEATRIGAIGEHHGITTYAANVTEDRSSTEYPDLWCVLVRVGFEFHERR
jgi:hypothetical protein